MINYCSPYIITYREIYVSIYYIGYNLYTYILLLENISKLYIQEWFQYFPKFYIISKKKETKCSSCKIEFSILSYLSCLAVERSGFHKIPKIDIHNTVIKWITSCRNIGVALFRRLVQKYNKKNLVHKILLCYVHYDSLSCKWNIEVGCSFNS